MARHTRRHLLGTAAGALAAGSLAGCLGDAVGDAAGSDGDGLTAQASFFVFGDLASQVAGDDATTETLVPTGQHGHGWEPGPKIQGAVLESDLFVTGVEGFQPWADDIAANLRDDGADVPVVRVGSNVDLREADHDHDDHEGDDHDDHEGDDHDDHEGDETDSHDTDHEGGDDHREGDDHDHSARLDGRDPHFWLDPIRVKRVVETIRAGFADADPDAADAYAENAGAYRSRLDDVHESFESALADAPTDVVLVAGHDAFGYLADRYGFEVEALTGLSPDDRPTPKAIERAQHVIADHDLEYVLADPLESQTAAEQLVAETDATEVLPLTSIPGRTDEWDERGWGYVDVMTEVNLPTLERALGAE